MIQSKSLLFVLLISCFVFVAAPRANAAQGLETIYIRADGSVDPPTPLIQGYGDVYYLTGNINSSGSGIVIQRNNTIFDGAGYALQGSAGAAGFNLTRTSNVTIRNAIVKWFYRGIMLMDSLNNTVTGNNMKNNVGIMLSSSCNNTISENNITGNSDSGIALSSSRNNIISGNNIANNYYYNVRLFSSSNNSVYYNNFVRGGNQVFSYNSTNAWDDGSKGNFWSDYLTRYADATPNGNIWDTPYVIDANNTDHYPLVNQPVIPEFPSFFILSLFMIATLAAVAAYKRRPR